MIKRDFQKKKIQNLVKKNVKILRWVKKKKYKTGIFLSFCYKKKSKCWVFSTFSSFKVKKRIIELVTVL